MNSHHTYKSYSSEDKPLIEKNEHFWFDGQFSCMFMWEHINVSYCAVCVVPRGRVSQRTESFPAPLLSDTSNSEPY